MPNLTGTLAYLRQEMRMIINPCACLLQDTGESQSINLGSYDKMFQQNPCGHFRTLISFIFKCRRSASMSRAASRHPSRASAQAALVWSYMTDAAVLKLCVPFTEEHN